MITADNVSGAWALPVCSQRSVSVSFLVVTSDKGPACPRCGRPMQIREHDRIRPKQLRQPFYYRRWFRCMHKDCKTTLVMYEEFKVWNSPEYQRLEAIRQQLRPRE
jgi:hypothetical protein